jgi:predicted DNA-binding protein
MNEDSLTSLTLRLPESLRERLKKQAKKEERTVSQCVRYHLANVLEQASGKKSKPAA